MCWTHCWPLECVFVPPRHARSVHKHTFKVHPGAHHTQPTWLQDAVARYTHPWDLPLQPQPSTAAAAVDACCKDADVCCKDGGWHCISDNLCFPCLHQLLVCPPRLTTSIAASVLISAASGAAATPLQLQLLVMQPTSMNSWSSALERMALAGILAEVARRRGPPPVIPTARPVTRGARSVSPDLEPPAPMAPCCCFYCCPHPCCCSCWLGMLAGYCCPTAAGAARDGVVPAGMEAYSTANTACHQGSRCSYDVT